MCEPPYQWCPCFCRAKDKAPWSPELSFHALAMSVRRDVWQYLAHPQLPHSPLESPNTSSLSLQQQWRSHEEANAIVH